MIKHFFTPVILLAMIFSVTVVSAQEKTYKNAFQTGPITALMGDYNLNYEHRISEKHAIVLGGSVSDSKDSQGYSLSLNYRHYKQPKGESGFWGIFAMYADQEGKLELDKKKYPFESTYFVIGANFGKRFLWDSGFSIVTRFGGGIPIIDFSWKDQENVPKDKNVAENSYKIMAALDGELSIGFCF